MDTICDKDKQIEELRREILCLKNMQQYTDIDPGFSACKSDGTSDTDAIVFKILYDLLKQFDGDRAYIFEIDWLKRTHSCDFEIVNGKITSVIDTLKGLPIDDVPWWRDRMQNNMPIVIDDTSSMPEQSGHEGEILIEQGIKSLIVMPLVSQGVTWGYIGIDMVDHHTQWSEISVEWFRSIANIINICMELKKLVLVARREKEHVQKLYDNMPVGFLRLKLIYNEIGAVVDYLHTEANPAIAHITSMPASSFLGKLGSEVEGIVDPERLHELLAIVHDGASHSDIMLDERSGRQYNYTIYPVEQDDVIVLFQDMTEIVQAGQALHRSEETMKNLFSTLPVGVEIYDKNGLLIDVNETEREMFGFKNKEDIIGLSIFANPLLPKEEIQKLKMGERIVFEFIYDFVQVQQSSYYDTECRGKKNLIVRGTPIFDSKNQIENYMLVVIDNTESIYTHNQLNRFESLFNSIAKVSEIGIFQWDVEPNTFFGTSQWFINLNQQSRDINDIIEAHSEVHPDDKQRLKLGLDAMFAGEIISFREEVRVSDNKGWKWLRCNFKIEDSDADGGVIQIIGLNIDITELKNTELKLIEAKAKAEESDRLKSAFVANMSHEIRTPLNAILGFSDLLIDTNDLHEKQQYTSIIRQNNELLLQLISDILDISKIESEIIEITKDTFDLNSLCDEIVISNGNKVQQGVELRFETKKESCLVRTDKNRVSQIVSNLVGNAIKFTPTGNIALGYQIEADQIKIYVRDTGLGISSKQVPIIFSRFVKLNSFIHGTGLGLPICKSLVERLGGKIWVDSQLGEGSCFWFTLPYDGTGVEVAVRTSADSVSAASVELGGAKPVVLIAEDTDSNYLLVSTILRSKYTLFRAYNGLEAVNMCAELNPDIILMDMKMPLMNGIEATTNIRKSNVDVPIIAVTAFAFESDRRAAFDAGCNDFVSKPINPELLRAAVIRNLSNTVKG